VIDGRETTVTQALLHRLVNATSEGPTPGGRGSAASLPGVAFDDATFLGQIDFEEVVFRGPVTFDRARFGTAQFDRAVFGSGASFVDTTFGGAASFVSASFVLGRGQIGVRGLQGVTFSGARFERGANFSGADLGPRPSFARTIFGARSTFRGTVFGTNASFEDAVIAARSSFAGSSFLGDATFDKAAFGQTIGFARARFSGFTSFEAAEFGPSVSFERCEFGEYVSFAGATLGDHAALGPISVGRQAILDGATIGGASDVAICAPLISCVRTRIPNGAAFRVDSDEVWLSLATFEGPTTFTGATVTTADRADARPPNARTPMIPSLYGTDVSGLVLADVDLRRCRFAGAHHLDRLRLEAGVQFAQSPVPWPRLPAWVPRPTSRMVLAEEGSWRAKSSDRDWPIAAPQPLARSTDRTLRTDSSLAMTEAKGVRDRLEARYRVVITDEAVATAAELSRYMTEKDRTDAALELISSAAAQRRAAVDGPSAEELDEQARLDVLLEEKRSAKEEAIERQEFERAAQLREAERDVLNQLTALEHSGPRIYESRPEVKSEDVMGIASTWTGLASGSLTDRDSGIPSVEPDPEPAQIAPLYRALRKGREDQQDAPGAADFYYGEMEMRRFSSGTNSKPDARDRGEGLLLTVYWLISGYALRPSRAAIALAVTIAVFASLFNAVGFTSDAARVRVRGVTPQGALVYESVQARSSLASDLIGAGIYSAGVATAILGAPERSLTRTGNVLHILLRILGPILIGLMLLSVRGRVKR
jgi:uncharacterized protein YjbI with pentapeptide repeats